MGWIGCAIQQVTSKGLPGFLFCFNILILIYFFKYETISTFAPTFWVHIISELGGVNVVLAAVAFIAHQKKMLIWLKRHLKCLKDVEYILSTYIKDT